MLVLHETDHLGKKALSGISSSPNKAYAKELAQRGYVVIAPDYPGLEIWKIITLKQTGINREQ